MAYGVSMTPKETLTAEDWIRAAFRALNSGGLQAIKAEAIARDLKVSKGSFYWHFKDVPSLKAEMLKHWAERGTREIINEIEATREAPAERLRLLVMAATSERSSAYGGEAVEGAIREWARHDSNAAAALKSVDGRRIAYLGKLFEECGLPTDRSRTSAHLFYGGLIGLTTLVLEKPDDLQNDMHSLLRLLLG